LKLAHYLSNGETRVGIVHEEHIFNLQDAAKKLGLTGFDRYFTIDQLLSQDRIQEFQKIEDKITATKMGVPINSVRILSPILNPEKILLVAVNYPSHGKEQNVSLPTEPYFFTKFKNALIGPGDPILLPRVSKKVDWEVELAVIIGKTGKYIQKKDALNYVAGYTISIDVSFRDLRYPSASPDKPSRLGINWMKAKALDSSFPLGPWLVTKDEIPNPHDLKLSLSVNGDEKQHSNTGEMLFKIDSLIEYISSGMTLNPGDIISTGTPEGVAVFSGQPFLKDGDIIKAKIGKIGMLTNEVKAE
jgi:2-keto-4-pentenoate hydratase/2-oxohepta-3-ene-1,7-dioic acid hydratase in catechol pathway